MRTLRYLGYTKLGGGLQSKCLIISTLRHTDGTLELRVYAGGDSIKTFRGNFLKRLAEVFFNLKQQLLQAPRTFRNDEFLAYEQLYLDLKNINYYSHSYVEFVEQLYRELRREVEKSAQEKTT